MTAPFDTVALIYPSEDVETTVCGMVILNPDMEFEVANKIMEALNYLDDTLDRSKECVKMNKGDFMLFCEDKYGQEAYQMFGEEEWDRDRNLKYVCKWVPQEIRREGLTFDHYRFVAPLERDDQEKFIEMAVSDELSTRALKQLIDATLVERILENLDEDEEFWRYFQAEMGCNPSQLQSAITEGKEAAEEILKAQMKVEFKLWFSDYEANEENQRKSEWDRMNDCWNTAVKRGV